MSNTTYKVEETLDEFQFWGDANNTVDAIMKYDDEHGTNKWEQLCSMAEEFFSEGLNTGTDINDWVAYNVPDYEEFQEIFN